MPPRRADVLASLTSQGFSQGQAEGVLIARTSPSVGSFTLTTSPAIGRSGEAAEAIKPEASADLCPAWSPLP